MSSPNTDKDKESNKPSPDEIQSGDDDKDNIKKSEKASAGWQDYSLANLNNVEYTATQAILPCGCQKVWRTPEPASNDVTFSDDEFYCPHSNNSKQ